MFNNKTITHQTTSVFSLLKHAKCKSKSVYTLIFVLSALLFANLYIQKWNRGKVIEWDITSYYGYLPATFIHKDLSLSFLNDNREAYSNAMQFWPKRAENGGNVFKMTMGMSVLYSPFFALGHIIAKYQGLNADGFSLPYHICIHLSSFVYLVLGFIFLRKSLLLFFSEYTTSIVLMIMALGTNLFYYATIQAAMSHAYTFSLISVFIYYCFRWHEKVSIKNTLILGVIGGLIVLVRPINILVFIFPLLLHVASYKDLQTKVAFFWGRKASVLMIALLVFIVLAPQFLYWKYVSGHFYFYSYGDEHFYFNNPHILEGLFSYRKGWLLYTPVMMLALLGFFPLYKTQRNVFWGILMFILLYIYVVFSWWCWWYGGSFGLRAMIDSYPLLAIPLAAFIETIFKAKSKIISFSTIAIVAVFVVLNIFQIKQYTDSIIHHEAMNKEAYWFFFMTPKEAITNEQWEAFDKLLKHPNYEKAMKGEDEYLFNP